MIGIGGHEWRVDRPVTATENIEVCRHCGAVRRTSTLGLLARLSRRLRPA